MDSAMKRATDAHKSIVFAFPDYVGHVNPSLPIARALVQLGHSVHYLCRENMRSAIEDTGATFHSDIDCQPELYQGREPHGFGALESLKQEHGIQDDSLIVASFKLSNVMHELQLPGVLRLLEAVKPSAVVYCAMVNREAALAAELLGIPSIALITHAGPGSFETLLQQFLSEQELTAEDTERAVSAFEPNSAATGRLRAKYGLEVGISGLNSTLGPMGKLSTVAGATSLVTTSDDLADPMSLELAEAYKADGSVFAYVGPLLDREGAPRGGASGPPAEHGDLVASVRAAREAGRPVVLVSMGTVVTSNDAMLGWRGRLYGADRQPRGLTGRELCHGAWAGAFNAFGAGAAADGALIVVAVGKQPDALEGIRVPPNVVCMPTVQQVDILKAGVDIFLTHGGQNSFTEAMAHAVPVVVCPGFGDQKVNSRKAADLGVGLKVDRPDPDAGGEAEAVERYRAEVSCALLKVFSDPMFKEAAGRCARRLHRAGGVQRAVEVITEAAAAAAGTAVAGSLAPLAVQSGGA